jgi:DNA-binding MarR family transcriptional regulator
VPSSVSTMESHLGYWLRLVSNSVSHGFAQKVAGQGVTVAEWVLLRELFEHQSAAPSMLAERLGLSRGAVSKLVDRLAAKQLATKKRGAGDARYQDVAITDAGRALVPRLAALADANDAEFFGHLAAEEAMALEGIVRRRGITGAAVD